MKLHLHYTAQLRAAVGRGEEELELPEGSTVADLLARLASQYHDARQHFTTPSGDIRPSLLVVVNDSAIASGEPAARVLAPGDVVMLLPPIAGG